MSQNLPKRSLRDFLSLRHPNHFVLAGANNRNVIITYRFLAAPVQENRDFLYIDCMTVYFTCKYSLNIRASYQGASSGFPLLGEIPCGGNKEHLIVTLHCRTSHVFAIKGTVSRKGACAKL